MPTIQRISPYAADAMNLPVGNVDVAVSFYTDVLGFQIVSRAEVPCKSIVLQRDNLQMAIAENGGDPSQEGCFFEVDDVEGMFAEFKSNGLPQDEPNYRIDQHGETSYKVFFVIAPDGLCFCVGQRRP